MSRSRRALDELPVELLGHIAQHLHAARDLRSLSVVSSLFCDVAERQLYARVAPRSDPKARRLRLALRRRPERLSFVRAAYLDGDRWSPGLLCSQLARCEGMEKFEMRSSWCSPAARFEDADDMRFHSYAVADMFLGAALHNPPERRQLPALTSVLINFVPFLSLSAHWALVPGLQSLFLSPTVRQLTLCCCEFTEQDMVWLDKLHCDRHQGQTPLETLHLECVVPRLDVARRILSLPRALKHLCFHPSFPGADEAAQAARVFANLDDWTAVLMQQKHALEELELPRSFAALGGSSGLLDLCGLEKLRTVALGWQDQATSEGILECSKGVVVTRHCDRFRVDYDIDPDKWLLMQGHLLLSPIPDSELDELADELDDLGFGDDVDGMDDMYDMDLMDALL